ncbi:hypothetical protein SDC9_207904 [bioreactor metagenome]|uniref:Uncharacterized protein n=1 Tax=bioreactor metagenome TaxID=1076179 RepID=A0A645JBP7_9ZZZZ
MWPATCWPARICRSARWRYGPDSKTKPTSAGSSRSTVGALPAACGSIKVGKIQLLPCIVRRPRCSLPSEGDYGERPSDSATKTQPVARHETASGDLCPAAHSHGLLRHVQIHPYLERADCFQELHAPPRGAWQCLGGPGQFP